MTIEDLKTLAAEWYKSAEEAIPVVGDGDKKEWMSNRLNEIVENEEPVLNCLLGYDTTSEVTDLMEKEYTERKEGTNYDEMPCATTPRAENQKTDWNGANNQSSPNPLSQGNNEQACGTVVTTVGYIEPGIIIEEEVLIMDDADNGSCGCSGNK